MKRKGKVFSIKDLEKLQRKAQKAAVQSSIEFSEKEMIHKPKKKRNAAEYRLQKACVRWFDLQFPNLYQFFFHVPNQAGQNNARTGKHLKEMGRRRGVWDMLLDVTIHKSLAEDTFRVYEGAWFDYKSEDGELTTEQELFREGRKDRYLFFEIKTVEEFIVTMKVLLHQNDRYNNWRKQL